MRNYTLGEIIAKYRAKNHISMREFAEKSGLSRAYISVLERDCNPTNGKKPNPSIQAIVGAAKAMEIDVIQLLQAIGFNIDVSEAAIIQPPPSPAKTGNAPKKDELEPFALIPVTTDSLREAILDRRILILPFRLPSRGSFLYYPSKEYGMTIPMTVTDVKGGIYKARHDVIGEITFSLFDIDRTIFTSRSACDEALTTQNQA